MSSEAEIHFELYRHLMNAISDGVTHHGITYTDATPERSIDGGFADIVVETEGGEPFLVIEAKREPSDRPDREIDPYATPVIDQASRYAVRLGAPYFATYNGRKLVLFQTFERGVPLLDRKSREYEVEDISEFASVLLGEVAGVHRDEVEWDPHSEAFINRLDSFHALLTDEFSRSLESALDDAAFVSEYENWIGEQGWTDRYEDDPEEIHAAYTSQAAYLFMNKLVFLKLLEDADAYVDVPDIDLGDLAEPDSRRDAFDQLMDNVDFEAVYEQEEIFDSLPLTQKAQTEVDSLTEELESYDLDDQFDDDVIGQIYKQIIPAQERHDLGQYYTPPRVVDLITRLTVESETTEILDPACGSGGFLVGAYNRLNSLGVDDHERVLSQINGVDINRFPAHLSAINLAIQDLSTETRNTNVEVADFFDLIPQQDRVAVERATVGSDGDGNADSENGTDANEDGGNGYEVDIPPSVDAVVANPPYIRSEQIDDVARVQDHLDGTGYDLDGNSDIYCYFFTHSSEFLDDGGRMGFLTSNRWLSADYGEELQEFLFDNMKLHAVIDFRQQMFDIPLISTCITILEKCDDPEERRENRTNLVHVKRRFDDVAELVEVVRNDEQEVGTMHTDARFRRATFRQATLRDMDRWDRYLFGPRVYFELLSDYGESLCTLGDLADVSRGFTSGKNSYFYFQDEDEYREWGIEPEFVSPLLKHISPTEYIDLTEADPTWYYLDTTDYVADVLDSRTEFGDYNDAQVVKDQLREDGYDGVVQYIEHGETEDLNDESESPTVTQKGRVWFDIGEPDKPPLILAKEYWRDARVLRNSSNVALDQRNYAIEPQGDVDHVVLLGVLNSSLTAMMREMEGREQQGQAMNRNELTVGDAEDMHIPDVRAFSEEARARIRSIVTEWLDSERDASEADHERFIDELDKAVLAALGVGATENGARDMDELDAKVEDVQQAVQDLVRRREQGAGLETEVLIGRQDDADDDFDLPGATRISDGGQSSLYSW